MEKKGDITIVAKSGRLIAVTSAKKAFLTECLLFCLVKCLTYGVKIIFADRFHLCECLGKQALC